MVYKLEIAGRNIGMRSGGVQYWLSRLERENVWYIAVENVKRA